MPVFTQKINAFFIKIRVNISLTRKDLIIAFKVIFPLFYSSDNAYTLQPPEILALKKKIETIGTPLKDWDIKIYRGVLTGFNKAFIIDTATKERLCKVDAKSAEIIKPMLKGRDIKAYEHHWAGLWIVATFPAPY
jgi:hypothetical protein